MKQVTYLAICLVLFSAGCARSGPKILAVAGTVTLDGTPISNAAVVFQPEFGRPAFATTDSNGHYELKYSDGQKGAAVGKNTVSIKTEVIGINGKPVQEELIPKQYNKETTLVSEVKNSQNKIDFDLKSK